MVVETHSHFIADKNAAPFFEKGFHVSFFGLPAFFFLSGLLVSHSLFNSRSWKNFMWKRIVRVYPAAICSILLCAFILGPVVTSIPLQDYFLSPSLFFIVTSCSLVHMHFTLPGVFENSILGPSVNASLWTISLELKLYLFLLLGSLVKIPGRRYLLMILIALLIISGNIFPQKAGEFFEQFTGRQFNPYVHTTFPCLFLIGVLCTVYKKKIIIRNYWVLLIVAGWIVSHLLSVYSVAAFVILPAFVLLAAVTKVNLLKKITPSADLSYGIYVFAFPVQQLIANYLHPADPPTMFVLSVCLVLPFALFSWYGVEKRALKWKGLVK